MVSAVLSQPIPRGSGATLTLTRHTLHATRGTYLGISSPPSSLPLELRSFGLSAAKADMRTLLFAHTT
ncbi:hypothetical protein CGRA01v4_13793 [Colletotrichum graminicola]|nr:hypothetical protein CGRA01v4_13793 [Colletotrichum graminicola]